MVIVSLNVVIPGENNKKIALQALCALLCSRKLDPGKTSKGVNPIGFIYVQHSVSVYYFNFFMKHDLVSIRGAWLEYIPYRDANRIFFGEGILLHTPY